MARRLSDRELVVAARRCPNRKQELVDAYLPSIATLAREYRGLPAVSREELMQAGVLGLLRALERYDPARRNPFWAYASFWVRQAMQDLVSTVSNAVVLSDRATRQRARINQARRDHVNRTHREPTIDELAAASGLSAEQVGSVLAVTLTPRGLDETPERSLADILPDPAGEDGYEAVSLRLAADALPELLAKLDSREQEIVRARYGLDGPGRTLQDLAGQLRLSVEGVRQIQHRALDKMREAAA